APAAASRDMYLDEDGMVIPRKSLDGHLAAGIPGTVAGAYLAHEKYGKMPMEKLIAPAVQLAEKGFVITALEAENLNESKALFEQVNTNPPLFVREQAWKEGDTLIQKDLAQTLKRIAEKGEKEFYEGETAQLIVDEMNKGEGLITLEDLKNYKAVERKPRSFSYKGYQVETMDLPSSGGLMLEMMLKMLSPYDLKGMGFQSPEAINHIVEVERRAYADRADYMGDPDFVEVPVDKLLDEAYLKSRMEAFEPGEAGNSDHIKPGIVEGEETTHLSILDQYGNAVAVTTTLNTNYGSGVVVEGAGFLLNNEMDDFSAKPGVPNEYGLLGTEANKIEPDKRPVSSMMPTIILKNDQPFMIVGTPGGSTIITSVLQSVLNVMEFDLSAEEAVNKPKFHHQWQPDVIYVEEDFDENIREELKEMGYKLEEREAIGRTEMILVQDGEIHSAADKRGDDSAAGF
ncbi:MAG TPA: gamma-glutamyltransferase, partial [Flavobacteriaceae bacterium]|nr:gamma-glutamyltransferase [Flavobacteriaceae bacterium]